MVCHGNLLAVQTRHRQDAVGRRYSVTWRVERIQVIDGNASEFESYAGIKDDEGNRVWYSVLEVVDRDLNKRQAMKVIHGE